MKHPLRKAEGLSVKSLAVVAAIATAFLVGSASAAESIVHNRGVGGENSRQGRARFDRDVVAVKPNYVFIYFGLNDTLNEPAFVPLGEFINNLDWMVDRSRKIGATPVVATIHPVLETPLLQRHKRESYGTEGPNGKIHRYNAAIRKMAKAKSVALADFAAVVEQSRLKDAAIVAPDGVHLTIAGNRALAQCFLDATNDKMLGAVTIVCIGDSVTFGVHNKGAGTAEGDTYPAMLRRLSPSPRKKIAEEKP